MMIWETDWSKKVDLPEYYYESEFTEINYKIRKNYRNFIKNRREKFIINFVIYDYYTNACLMKDNIIVRARNVNNLNNKYKLEHLIRERYYPMKFGKIKILNIRRG